MHGQQTRTIPAFLKLSAQFQKSMREQGFRGRKIFCDLLSVVLSNEHSLDHTKIKTIPAGKGVGRKNPDMA